MNSGVIPGQSDGIAYPLESEPIALLGHLDAIRRIADSEKEALGFLPEAAFRDAILNRRLVAILRKNEVAGYILFSGVFPNAKVQQIAVAPSHRRSKIASTLINHLVSHLEVQGYTTLSAAVASDLPAAQAFYEEMGFIARTTRRGGAARGRTIILRARDLENQSLFSFLKPAASEPAADLGLQLRAAGQAPLYAIDLNVLFDAVKGPNRSRAPLAESLVGAALAHQFRLAVAAEFLTELERNTKGVPVDPILELARRLPRLGAVDPEEQAKLSEVIHDLVFVQKGLSGANTVQARSDAQHIAHAALARASGYVTSDGSLLAARTELRGKVGIDVASLEEFVALLAENQASFPPIQLEGTDCRFTPASLEDIRSFLLSRAVSPRIIEEFSPKSPPPIPFVGCLISEATQIIGVGALHSPPFVDTAAKMLVHVRHDNVACEIFADKLIDSLCTEACRSSPISIELTCPPGQSVVRRAAVVRGFLPLVEPDLLLKVAIGRPITSTSWEVIAQQIRRRTGLILPDRLPNAEKVQEGIIVTRRDGNVVTVRLSELEEMFSPTIIAWPGRRGVIVPIASSYSDDLLGTSGQLRLFGSKEALFTARRTYFCSPRVERLLRPLTPVLFYESKRSGGQRAIVAVARVADATVIAKDQIPTDIFRRGVVQDVENFSTSPEVLAVSFDTVLNLPRIVPLEELDRLQAKGPSNLQTSTPVNSENLTAILDFGWPRA